MDEPVTQFDLYVYAPDTDELMDAIGNALRTWSGRTGRRFMLWRTLPHKLTEPAGTDAYLTSTNAATEGEPQRPDDDDLPSPLTQAIGLVLHAEAIHGCEHTAQVRELLGLQRLGRAALRPEPPAPEPAE